MSAELALEEGEEERTEIEGHGPFDTKRNEGDFVIHLCKNLSKKQN